MCSEGRTRDLESPLYVRVQDVIMSSLLGIFYICTAPFSVCVSSPCAVCPTLRVRSEDANHPSSPSSSSEDDVQFFRHQCEMVLGILDARAGLAWREMNIVR